MGAAGSIGARSPQLRLHAEGGKKSGLGGAVVDDSDFDFEDKKKKKSTGKSKNADLNRILESADSLAIKKAPKRKSKTLVSLEDELAGLSLTTDEDDIEVTLMTRAKKAARSGSGEVSVSERLVKWAAETKDLITNPTPIQLTYVSIFSGTVGIIILAGVLAASAGLIRYQGIGIDQNTVEKIDNSPYAQRMLLMQANRQKARTVENINELMKDDDFDRESYAYGEWGMTKSMPKGFFPEGGNTFGYLNPKTRPPLRKPEPTPPVAAEAEAAAKAPAAAAP